MTPHILIAGGYGVVGAHIARHLRRDHPGVKLTLAGRAPDAGAALAAELDATTARLDVAAPGEGLAAIGPVDLIVAALHDPSDSLIAAAMGMGAGHIGITRTADTISPAAFAAARRATRRPVVPLGHWQAGILTMATMHAAAAFARVDRIALTAVYDMADPIGPLTAGDSEGFSGRALLRENGAWIWAEGGTRPRRVAIDGGETDAAPVGVLDLLSLAAVTNAPDIRFDLAIATSITGRSGHGASHDLYIDLQGDPADGGARDRRLIVSAPAGQAHLTGLGVALAAERLLGLDGQAPPPPGFLPPENLLDPDTIVARLRRLGVHISDQPPE